MVSGIVCPVHPTDYRQRIQRGPEKESESERERPQNKSVVMIGQWI